MEKKYFLIILIIVLFAVSISIFGFNDGDSEGNAIVHDSVFKIPDSYSITDDHSDHEVEISNDTNRLVVIQMIGSTDLDKTINEYNEGLNNSISIGTFKTPNGIEIKKTSITLDNKTYVRYYFEKSNSIFHIDTQNEVNGTDAVAAQIIDSMNVK